MKIKEELSITLYNAQNEQIKFYMNTSSLNN